MDQRVKTISEVKSARLATTDNIDSIWFPYHHH